MATILLGAAGAAVGSAFSGTVLGLTGAVIGRAVGATLGRAIDQRLLGTGSEAVETGRVERFRLMGASEGAPLGLVFGRMRVSGQVIWATRFREERTTSGGGKGAPRPSVTEYSYSVSLAIALCEGVVQGIGRIWADGIEIEPGRLNLRLYTGAEDQLPDPRIEAVEGAGQAPAYRGVAYVVIEDLALAEFGNRVPQFAFEVIRPAQPALTPGPLSLRDSVKAVAMMPGTGEYALATTRVHLDDEPGRAAAVNVHAPTGKSDFATALDQLRTELPGVGSVSLIVSWFGDDLRCGTCQVKPKVEQTARDGVEIPWRAGGIARAAAETVPVDAGASVYGGTPADGAVIEAIRAIRDGGQKVMFYPFILMEQLAGNGRPDPWTGAPDQPVLPWRGRITTAVAPGRAGTADRSAAAAAEVAAFFGTAAPGDFAVVDGRIDYSGPVEWRYRRFILHYAQLCALAGGVDAFCIGSEMRGLTQIRGAGDTFPAVAALVTLAAEVRAILGPAVEISYAADWTEYSGYLADGNLYFHLDPLWASPAVDFVGIDNYMPLSDWRGTAGEADAAFGSPYALDYLGANVAGGEGFDWYYDSPEGRAAQRRLPIEDGAHGEPWVFRVKDLAGWWSNTHHERIGGVRSEAPTAWLPGSKPIRFTEYGCAAIDKGTNEPNRFLDPKSSESGVPVWSDGRRDDLIQMQYYRAFARHFADAANNPVSGVYGGPMVEMDFAHAWAWDARPFPAFPGNADLWQDAGNYPRGHWLTGRATHQSLAGVLAELCGRAGAAADVGRAHGVVRGFAPEGVGAARSAIQALMLAQAFDAVERGGVLAFRMRGEVLPAALDAERLAVEPSLDGALEVQRASEAEVAGAVRLAYVEAEGDFATRQAEAVFPDETARAVSQTDLPMLLTPAEARGITERWLAEARVARDGARFALPPSAFGLGAGDVVALDGGLWRIDRVETAGPALAEAVRVEPGVYRPSDEVEERVVPRPFTPPGPVLPLFLDLPLITGDEVSHAPHVAAVADPWPGSVAVWSAPGTEGFTLNTLIAAASVVGVTETVLPWARPGLWDRGPALRVRLVAGSLAAATEAAVLNGANLIAIGDGTSDRWELFQFAGATLVAPRTHDLSLRLRGQLGTEGVAPAGWPAGSRVVLIDGAPRQIALALSARGLARTYRVGASARGFDDPDVAERVEAFQGIGLRPYAPAHLRVAERGDGGLELTWVRRTRIEGDSWESLEVPLGEDREAYLVRILAGGEVRREVEVAGPRWTYGAADRLSDVGFGALVVSVAQVSDRFGAGVFGSLTLG